MGIISIIRKCAIQHKVRREQKPRERCVQYAKDNKCAETASICRFIMNGTYLSYDLSTKEMKEYIYPILEGVIHQVENAKSKSL